MASEAAAIGVNIGRKGLKDEEIVVLLRGLRAPTFFTRDAGFYQRELRHRGYCLVLMSVEQHEVAAFVRRFLRHPDFDTHEKRMGRVIRISHAGLAIWRVRAQTEIHIVWTTAK